jgi:hypothetical protein
MILFWSCKGGSGKLDLEKEGRGRLRRREDCFGYNNRELCIF